MKDICSGSPGVSTRGLTLHIQNPARKRTVGIASQRLLLGQAAPDRKNSKERRYHANRHAKGVARTGAPL